MRQRIESLLKELNKGIWEKDSEISLSLLAALAGESIILLGPPGVAKSMVARRLKLAFEGANSFEYLMSRFSTPDEIFGPVSISRLKKNDVYERAIEGYLPTADVVFLDEIWKAGPAIQNTLLTVINEKLFRNGANELHLPLKLLIAASNELPAKGEGLEALWDRFIIRLECQPITSEQSFNAMLLDKGEAENCIIATDVQIKNEEYAKWQNDIAEINISQEVLKAINNIRHALRTVSVEGDEELHNIYISDRRWKKIVRLIRTSAFINNRKCTTLADLLPAYHCLWQEPEERDAVRIIVIQALFDDIAKKMAAIKSQLDDDIQNHRSRKSTASLSRKQQMRDSDKKIYSNYYFRLTDQGTGRTFVVMTDYQQLPDMGGESINGVLYRDPRDERVTVIRINTGARTPLGSRPVSLARDTASIYIDGVRYELEKRPRETEEELPLIESDENEHDYASEIDTLADAISNREKEILSSLFVSKTDKQQLTAYLQDFYKEIAFTRQDIAKL